MDTDSTRYKEFHEVFNKYYSSLCNYSNSIINDIVTAEDIVQDSFVSIWDKKKDLIGTNNIRFYLFTVVRNNSLSFISNQNKRRFIPIEQSQILQKKELSNPTEIDEVQDYNKLIDNALQLLPPKCKEVFILTRISKLSYAEVSKTLGISIKTVENQMGKAIRIVRNFTKENRVYIFILLLNIFTNSGFC